MTSPRTARFRGPIHTPFLAVLFLLFLAGCGRNATTPAWEASAHDGGTVAIEASQLPIADANEGLLVRLVEGDHATLDQDFRARTTLTGETEPGPWVVFADRRERTTLGTDVKAGVTYVVQEEVSPDAGTLVSLLRQDRSGLYLYQEDAGFPVVQPSLQSALAGRTLTSSTRIAFEKALARILVRRNAVLRGAAGTPELEVVSGPGGRVTTTRPGGVGPNEITFLRYPLYPGATWDGRVGFNVWTVEALEQLTLPAGRFRTYRLDIDLPEFFGPSDRYTIWYGTPGEVAHAGHFIEDAVDDTGEIVGTVEVEDNLKLTAWSPAD